MAVTTTASEAAQRPDAHRRFRSRQFENARRHSVDVLFFIYLILIFDGVLRKYGLPEYQRPLILLRDPVVFYLYIHALRHGLMQRSAFLFTGLVFAMLTIIVVGIQMETSAVPTFMMVYGFRMYYSLLLLPFVMAVVLNNQDLQRFFRLNLILVTLMAPLMVLQVVSSPQDWINTGGAMDDALLFRNLSYAGFVRPSGFFTSTGGAGPFLMLVGAIVLSVALMPKSERGCSQRLFVAGTLSLMVCASVCGNRGALLGLLLVGVGALLLTFILPPGHIASSRAVTRAVALAIGGLVVALVFFPKNFDAMEIRWTAANANVGPFQIIYRALDSFVDFVRMIELVPPDGVGMGAGTNAATAYLVTSTYGFEAESGWSRHIVDLGPFLGITFIVWRIALTIYVGMVAFKHGRRSGDHRPWLIFAAMGHIILFGQTSGNSDVAGFAWFAIGLILAAPNYVRSN